MPRLERFHYVAARSLGLVMHDPTRRIMSITCGIDWAEAHHDVAVMDDAGRILGRLKIDTGVGGFGRLMLLLAEHSDDPVSVPIAIETDKNLIVAALQAGGFTVY